jgi:hypothetical protein
MTNADDEIFMIEFFHTNKLAMMTMILKYVCDWFNQHWVNLHTFSLRFIQIYLKLSHLIRNYLAEEEKYKFNYFDPLICNYLAKQAKNSIRAIDYW